MGSSLAWVLSLHRMKMSKFTQNCAKSITKSGTYPDHLISQITKLSWSVDGIRGWHVARRPRHQVRYRATCWSHTPEVHLRPRVVGWVERTIGNLDFVLVAVRVYWKQREHIQTRSRDIFQSPLLEPWLPPGG